MDIYVDGSTLRPSSCKQRSSKKRALKPGSGYAIVTEDKIFMKSYTVSLSVHFMEFRALIAAIRMAKSGDTIYTDQGTIVDLLAEHGDPTFATRPERIRPYNHIIKTQILRALKKAEGVTIEYIPSNEAKKNPAGHITRLADYFSGFASGARTKHVLTYKGDREVIAL